MSKRTGCFLFAALLPLLLGAEDVTNITFDPDHRHLNNEGGLEVSFDLPSPSSIEAAYLEVMVDGVTLVLPNSEIDDDLSATGNTITIRGADLYDLVSASVRYARIAPRFAVADNDALLATDEDATAPYDDEDLLAPDEGVAPGIDADDPGSAVDGTTADEDDLFTDDDSIATDWPAERDGQYTLNLVVVVDRDAVTDVDVDVDVDADADTDDDTDTFAAIVRYGLDSEEVREAFSVTLDNVPPAAPTAATVEGGNRKLLVTVTPSEYDALEHIGEQIGAYHIALSGRFLKDGAEVTDTVLYDFTVSAGSRNDETHDLTIESKDGYTLLNNDDGGTTYRYSLRIWAEDLAGNAAEDRALETEGSAVTTEGFWSHYRSAGGTEKGDYCFIATAGYGDVDHRFVRTLRHWRDAFLSPSVAGRAFIAWYYRTGPVLAQLTDALPGARPLVQLLLFPLVLVAWTMLHPWTLMLLLFPLLSPLFKRRRGAGAFLLVALFWSTTAFCAEETITVKEEKKEEEQSAKEEDKVELHGDFLFAGGFYDAGALDHNVPGSPIAAVLTDGLYFLPTIHAGIDIPAGKYLKLTPHLGIGFVELKGRAVKLDGTTGTERTYFYILPVMAEIKLRPVYDFPVRPYLAAGLDYYFWWIIEEKKLAEDGGKFGFHGSVGVQISLNFIDPKTAIRLRESTGIIDTALFAHYRIEQVDNFFSKKGFDLSSSRFEFGIIFDY